MFERPGCLTASHLKNEVRGKLVQTVFIDNSKEQRIRNILWQPSYYNKLSRLRKLFLHPPIKLAAEENLDHQIAIAAACKELWPAHWGCCAELPIRYQLCCRRHRGVAERKRVDRSNENWRQLRVLVQFSGPRHL